MRSILLLIAISLFMTGCSSSTGRSSSASAPEEASSFGAEAEFLTQVRGDAEFPDEDDVLIAIGRQFCAEVAADGEEAAVANMDESSFSFEQKLALSVGARQNLCPE